MFFFVVNLGTFFLEGMDAANQVDHIPPPEFHEYVKDPLIELSPTDSKELWLIQWPMNQVRFFGSFCLSLPLRTQFCCETTRCCVKQGYRQCGLTVEKPLT